MTKFAKPKLQLIGIAKTWACKSLAGWDDQAHRDLLARHGATEIEGRVSASTLNTKQLLSVLDDYERRGWPRVRKDKPDGRTLAQSPESRKVRALWLMLHALGQVRDPSEAALAAYVKRMSGVDALQWSRNPHVLIESLKSWAMRHLPQHVAKRMATLDVKALAPSKLREINFMWASMSHLRHDGAGGSALFDYYWSMWELLKAVK